MNQVSQEKEEVQRTKYEVPLSGDFVGRVTPVPVPNTEVKPAGADGTARVTAWESRKSPGLLNEARESVKLEWAFCDLVRRYGS